MSKKARTPKKRAHAEDTSLLLSPTFASVAISPGRSPSSGNLTGSARKVKDAAADWHNYIEKWDTLRSQGSEVIQKISNIKLEAIFSNENIRDVEEDTLSNAEMMPLTMEKHTNKLLTIYTSMEKLIRKLENITRILKGVSDLEWHQNNESFCEEPLFKTWQISRFYDVSFELLSMYQKEIILKKTIVENIAHASDRDTIMTLSSAWIHEPYIEDNAQLLLEGLLHETGHR